MGLDHADFALTDEQLAKINKYFQERAQVYAQTGEDNADCAQVTLAWIPGFGRLVKAYFDGEIEGFEIEVPLLS